ncbi:MAG: metal ABC transporter ATP-binding protein [Nitriliruptorales bacterium]
MSGAGHAAHAIRVESLHVRRDGRAALRDVGFAVPTGRLVAIIGPNGAGKSTLLDVLAGLLPPSSGRVEVLGGSPLAVRPRIAYVLQAAQPNGLVPLTVREAVVMGRYAVTGPFGRLGADDREAVDRAMERLAVRDLADRQLAELSTGQRQRVLVAQGLSQEASVLLLDEAATGLDLPSQERIRHAVADEVRRGTTVLFTTHDVADAAAADQVLLLATDLVADGPPAEILSEEPLATAFGAHVHRTPDGMVLVDDPHHHEHEARR